MLGPPELAGYVADIPYVAGFKPMLAPAWLDFVALLGGKRPPSRTGGFAWCDLGCGQGVTAAILAATHPDGAFHGIDAMAVHVDHAAGLAAEAGAANAQFHAADFAAALSSASAALRLHRRAWRLQLGRCETRASLRQFIDRRLKPGGLVYVSYNALPGWTGDLPFQHLVRALAANARGDSAARFAAASRLIDRLADSGAAALASSYIVRELRERPDDYRPGYLVHEFLHGGWRPLYVTELRRDMAKIGLAPVGSAILLENFDSWILGRRARALVAEIADPDLRELVRDFVIDQRFRCDVFARDAAGLDEGEQRRLLFAAGLALARPPAAIAYRAPTPAGQLDYDNPAARAVVGALAAGARSLSEIPPRRRRAAGSPGQCPGAVRGGRCAAGRDRARPVEALNRALRRRFGARRKRR